MDIQLDRKLMGCRIDECRKKADLSQEELAALVGISAQHMSNIINSHTGVKLATLFKIATVLDADLNYLTGADTKYGMNAMDDEFHALLSSMSFTDKQICLALCRAYMDHRPVKVKDETNTQ